MKIKKQNLFITGIIIFFILAFISVFAGTRGLGFSKGIKAFINFLSGGHIDAGTKLILLKVRLPRVIAAVFCGSALSVAGLILQTSLNNTLASPGIIGINSGAGLFVLAASVLFPYSVAARTAGAFTGAALAVFIVYFISRNAGISKTPLVLAGVAVSSLMSAGIDVIITMRPEIVADKVAFSLGGFQNLNMGSLYFAVPLIIICIVILLFLSGGIELFSLGDEAAFGLGLNVNAYRIVSILISGILAGCAVSVCGLLGFIGLIVPNFVRLVCRENVRTKILLTMILGADFLMLCDLISRLLFYPYELPVGLFLSCLGSPFFIWILISRKKHLSV